MILYLSGNFPQLVSPNKETNFRKDLFSKNHPYHRLVTFYYPKHCETVFNILRDEDKELWHKEYMNRLIEVGNVNADQAKEALEAAMGEYDYTMNPVDAADEEISYWD